MFNSSTILTQAKFHNSFYLYDEEIILEYTNQLKTNFPDVTFLYSIKTNHHPQVAKTVFSQGFGADAASLGEVLLSNDFGLAKIMIHYSAPGKLECDIAEAMEKSTIIADSLTEIAKIEEIAKQKSIIAEIGIRINPDFTFYADKGSPSKFGIDEQDLYNNIAWLKSLKHIKIIGIHVHLRSQELHAQVLKNYYEKMLVLAQNIQSKLNINLLFINMGSGLGIPYSANDTALNIEYLGKQTVQLMQQFKKQLPQTRIFIETGRYAVCKSGVYVTKVVDVKTSHGKKFVILNNTLNGFIRPSLAQLIMNYTKDENLQSSEPLFTSESAFEIFVLNNEKETETVTLVGNLCTATDVVAKDITLPKVKSGDVVVMTNAGSYAAVISPMQFSTQVPPEQLFLTKNGDVV